MNRTAFLVDGFNLYHSLKVASEDLGGVTTKWLDLRSLCVSYLSSIGNGARLESLIYFSAFASYREAVDPDVTARHRAYIECLTAAGVDVRLGKFKEKEVTCPRCGRPVRRHEEKETDVAIGVELVDLFWRDACDSAVLVTGDSDLVPAVRVAQGRFPAKRIYSLFPHRRRSFELAGLVAAKFRIRADRYLRHQLPNPCPVGGGRSVPKPATW